jgi:hypothetical protein
MVAKGVPAVWRDGDVECGVWRSKDSPVKALKVQAEHYIYKLLDSICPYLELLDLATSSLLKVG